MRSKRQTNKETRREVDKERGRDKKNLQKVATSKVGMGNWGGGCGGLGGYLEVATQQGFCTF